ncbi:group II truncated hemoglobin [Hyphococcus sp.]|uniref:group II truncated hemoglobin n=1 Tax=Hyphococcus sp. TaxID=2038636 RepID=UPI0035C6CE52
MPTDVSVTEAEKPKPATAYEMIGGAEPVARIVNRFYDLVETDPAYAALRAMHAPDLAPMRASLTGFLIAWMGGPRGWFDNREKTCMMTLHRPLAIDEGLAEEWAGAMARAVDDCEIEPDFAKQMIEVLRRMCAGMVNS